MVILKKETKCSVCTCLFACFSDYVA